MNGSPILRWEKGRPPRRAQDELAGEEPLEIRVEDRPVAVTMRTPGHDEELAVGFLASEGLIRSREQVVNTASHPRNLDRNVIGVFLADGVEIDFKSLTRHTFVSSSCGLCGKASIESVRRHFPPIRGQVRVSAETLLALPEKLRHGQTTFSRTGGLHAAGIFDLDGNLVVLREDVGRHNAVDKVLGRGFLDGLLPFDRHILMVSGRASFEIMQKALAGRLPIVAAVSAPSSLAVEFARASRQTLAGFVREERMNVYAGAKRVRFPMIPGGVRKGSGQKQFSKRR
jgi:FdhD protein